MMRAASPGAARRARRSAAVAVAAVIALAAACRAQPGATIDRIVAVVGSEIITQSELDFQLMRFALQNRVDIADTAVRSRVLDELMNRKLILAQAQLDSVMISDEQVTARLDEQIRYMERSYGSQEELERRTGMTVAQMRREYREEIRKMLMIDAVQSEKFGQVSVTSREVEEFFRAYGDSMPKVPEQVELRQITVFPRVIESFTQQARQKAQRLLDSLRGGADFSALARAFSDDAGSAANGGDLGFARRGVFVKEFEEAAFNLQPGDLSPVVETQFGFHILRMIERKGESVRVQHILVRVQRTGESDSAAVQTLAGYRQRILAGEDFAALAREHTEDAATRSVGGDLGLLETEQLAEDLRQVQQSLMPGGISLPVRLTYDRDYAYAIVQLVRRVPPHAPTLKDDYQRVAGFARVYKQNTLYTAWIDDIKKNVYWHVIR